MAYELKNVNFNNINEQSIVNLWKVGFTVLQISKAYMKSEKKKGNRLTIRQAQQYVEPIIFDYQTSLLKV